MGEHFKENRHHDRIAVRLPTNVCYRTAERFVVREFTFSINVSPGGLCFLLRTALEIGQIVEVSLPLPAGMRQSDAPSENFGSWAVVRHCSPNRTREVPVFHIGAAFVGPTAPNAYLREPLRLYRLDGIGSNGFWTAIETGETVDRRRHTRHAIPLGVSLTLADHDGNVLVREDTVTENISLGGATVFSSIPVQPGDLVKIRSEQYNVSLTAEVRSVRSGNDGLPRIHLRFIDGDFPLKGIDSV